MNVVPEIQKQDQSNSFVIFSKWIITHLLIYVAALNGQRAPPGGTFCDGDGRGRAGSPRGFPQLQIPLFRNFDVYESTLSGNNVPVVWVTQAGGDFYICEAGRCRSFVKLCGYFIPLKGFYCYFTRTGTRLVRMSSTVEFICRAAKS